METNKCLYHNCNNDIEDTKRKGTKFCCRNCKQKYRRVIKNKEKRLKLSIEENKKIIENYKLLQNLLKNT